MSELSKQIQSLDLTSVMARLKRESGLNDETLTKAETQYRQFLQLCLNDTGSVPTELADKVWHCHIIDTKKYAADCEALFGEFMHHNPHIETNQALAEAAQQTKLAWQNYFKKHAEQPYHSAICSR